MEEAKQGIVSRIGCGLWKGLDTSRRVVVNLIFLAIVIALFGMLLSDDDPDVPDTAALVLSPNGVIVEQLDGDSVERALNELRGVAGPQTLLKDLLDAIAIAKDDERIEVLLLDLSNLRGAGFTKLQDLKEAIAEFKESGKKVIATGDNYNNAGYYLAAHADEIYLHYMGAAIPNGFGRYRTYYKDGIDRLEVDYNIFKVGKFKSAVEPYLRNDMSDAAKEANLDWLGDLWRAYLADVSAARGISEQFISEYIDSINDHLDAAQGRTAQAALTAGLVDFVGNRDLLRERMIELVGEDEESHSYYHIGHKDYLEANDGRRKKLYGSGEGIGVIVAKGTILGGNQQPGKIGGDSTAKLIRQARNDDSIKAIVLRVDSGGGSAFASEVIRRELELTQKAEKPVVVSMGSVAASGGYWITMSSDEVWASPTTITGSIGIFGMFPTVQKPLAKYLGVRVDGVGTTWLSGAYRLDRALDPEIGRAIQKVIDSGYQDFISKVGKARNMTTEEVDLIAQGRVWSGEDAHRWGLVDQLGGLDDAIASAAQKAGLEEGYKVSFVEKKLKLKDRIMRDLLARAVTWVGRSETVYLPEPPMTKVMRQLTDQAEILTELNDPHGVYAYCMEASELY
jgi:protease-4